jgi:quinol-cytochrome oxidoreductase complex cytochrome b subunit
VPFIGRELRDFLLGGAQIAQATLLRFYVLHIAVLTIAFVLLWAVHIWRVRKDGFQVADAESGDAATRSADASVAPSAVVAPDVTANARAVPPRVLGDVERQGDDARPHTTDHAVFSWPHLIVRHQAVALATCVVVILMGIAWEAPLRDLANPSLTPEPAKAPWYFVGLQELLAHFHPLIAGVLVPAAIIVGLMALPYLDTSRGRTPRERKVALGIFGTACTALLVLTIIGAFFRGPGWQLVMPWQHLYFEP